MLRLNFGDQVQLAFHSREVKVDGQFRLVELNCDLRKGKFRLKLETFDDKEMSDENALMCCQELSETFTELLAESYTTYPTIHA